MEARDRLAYCPRIVLKLQCKIGPCSRAALAPSSARLAALPSSSSRFGATKRDVMARDLGEPRLDLGRRSGPAIGRAAAERREIDRLRGRARSRRASGRTTARPRRSAAGRSRHPRARACRSGPSARASALPCGRDRRAARRPRARHRPDPPCDERGERGGQQRGRGGCGVAAAAGAAAPGAGCGRASQSRGASSTSVSTPASRHQSSALAAARVPIDDADPPP